MFAFALTAPACSIRKVIVGQVANAVSSGGPSPVESIRDVDLARESIPSFLVLFESLLDQVPKHRGLLTQLSQGYASYTYLGVQQSLDRARDEDYRLADKLKARAKWLYLRGNDYGLRGLEASHRGFREKFTGHPADAAKVLNKKDLPLMYWTAANLGLAISSGRDDVDLIARIPEVDALIARGLQLDETWRDGAFHEFAIVLAAAKPGRVDYESIEAHYERAVQLSRGASVGIFVTKAESVSVPRQQRGEFREMLERALAPNPEEPKNMALMNELARRRADWLLERMDDLILNVETANDNEKEER
jgi:predicted anti-sigma-YlaC factor YlaD